jgi:transcriptional regulator with XRE-family HTH domain
MCATLTVWRDPGIVLSHMKVEPVYHSIGAIIRSKRRQLEWSQEKLAQHVRISRATLANIETGRQRILVHQVYIFATALGARPDEFLPSLAAGAPATARMLLPIPGGLKPQQREQIAQLIEAAEIPATSSENHGKT